MPSWTGGPWAMVALCLLECTTTPALGFMPLIATSPGLMLNQRAGRGLAASSSERCAGSALGAQMMADGTMPNHKVVVTGIGAVSAIGSGSDFMPALLKGDIGIEQLPEFAAEFPCRVAGTVKDFDATAWFKNKKEAKRQSRYMHFGVAATKLGLEDAKLDSETIEDKSRFGVFIGSAIGGSEFYEEASEKWARHSEYAAVPAGQAWGDESFSGR